MLHGVPALISHGGKGFKYWTKRIRGQRYSTQTWHIDAVKCGASLWSSYVVTFCYPRASKHKFPVNIATDTSLRSYQNLIRTYGPKPSPFYPVSQLRPSTHPTRDNYAGTLFGQPVYNWNGPFCSSHPNIWILVPDYGICRVQLEEMVKLKGLQDSNHSDMSYPVLVNSIEQHVWASICKVISLYFNLLQIYLLLLPNK